MSDRKKVDNRRQGEDGPLPQRRTRTFYKGDGWYFMTREHVDVGPFISQELAEIGVQDYAGFSMDADNIHPDPRDVVPDESGLDASLDQQPDDEEDGL